MNTEINEPLIDALRVGKLGDLPAAAIPPGYKLENLSRFLSLPVIALGVIAADTLESLVGYLESHSTGGTAVFACRDSSNIVAVIDWHTPKGSAGWGRHTVKYQLGHTPEWKAWTGISGRAMTQAAFAEFIEENLPDVIEPDSATVLEAIRTVSGKRNIQFESSKNLANGDTQIVWKEETEAAGGQRGEAALPSELKIRIPVYRGAEKATTFEVKAFLRYRINDGKLTFELKLHRPEVAVELAYDEILAELKSSVPSGTVIYCGSIQKAPDACLG